MRKKTWVDYVENYRNFLRKGLGLDIDCLEEPHIQKIDDVIKGLGFSQNGHSYETILRGCYGLKEEKKTLKEVSKIIKVTPASVRQFRLRAENRMRALLSEEHFAVQPTGINRGTQMKRHSSQMIEIISKQSYCFDIYLEIKGKKFGRFCLDLPFFPYVGLEMRLFAGNEERDLNVVVRRVICMQRYQRDVNEGMEPFMYEVYTKMLHLGEEDDALAFLENCPDWVRAD